MHYHEPIQDCPDAMTDQADQPPNKCRHQFAFHKKITLTVTEQLLKIQSSLVLFQL